MAGHWHQYPWSEEPVWLEEPEPPQTSFPTAPAPRTAVRTYPQQEADGSVTVVTEWSDGTYTKELATPATQSVGVGGGNINTVAGGGTDWGAAIKTILGSMSSGSSVASGYIWKALEAQIAKDTAQLNLQKQQWITQLGKSPRDWIKYWQAQGSPGGTTTTTATPTGLGYTDADIANINQQLVAAGWGGGTDEEAIAAFLRTIAPGTQADLVARLQKGKIGGTTTTTMPPEPQWFKDIGGFGALPTMQLSPKTWGQLQPSKQEAIGGALEYTGEYEPDWMKRVKQTWPSWSPAPATAFRW